MALIDDIRSMLQTLADEGWRELFAAHGLNIDAADLEGELGKVLPVDRTYPGFEDFALEGVRGVTPGQPAQSLLYHALASPNVVSSADGQPLGAFPTLTMIELVENYVFAAAARNLSILQAEAARDLSQLAIVVFAYEYRPATGTPHRRHADLCFSRTGISRVGTAGARYEGHLRGFHPEVDGDPAALAAVPARYSAWLAVARSGSVDADRPMRPGQGDGGRQFWVPVHKLFNGPECLEGFDLALTFESFHLNEKLKRIHENFDRLKSGGSQSPVPAALLDEAPYRFTDGIAKLSNDANHGGALLAPVPHAALVEPASNAAGELVGFPVPAGVITYDGGPTIRIPPLDVNSRDHNPRLAPEYVHARTELLEDGTTQDLNDIADVGAAVRGGNYQALHYVDYTGDGWIDVSIPALGFQFPTTKAAYSLVTAPDFFARAEQRELAEWGDRVEATFGPGTLWRLDPAPLNEGRLPANLQLPGSKFAPEDDTITAIVAFETGDARGQTASGGRSAQRSPCLPDSAGHVFEPGWDVSKGVVEQQGQLIEHLAAFGLGSPFPEDAKLCSALSAFWPGASPDTSQMYPPGSHWPTVTPLTDEEMGRGGEPAWDGVPGPREIDVDGVPHIDFPSFDHADYTLNAANNSFLPERFRDVGRGEFLNRTAVMFLAYRALGLLTAPDPSELWRRRAEERVSQFRRVPADDPELIAATGEAGTTMNEPVYRLELVPAEPVAAHPNDPQRRIMPITRRTTMFIGNGPVIRRENDGNWINSDALIA